MKKLYDKHDLNLNSKYFLDETHHLIVEQAQYCEGRDSLLWQLKRKIAKPTAISGL
mgnify:CR=1 FL=1